MAKKKNDKEVKEKKALNMSSMGSELKKVTWPNGQELSKATGAVLFLVFAVALIIFFSDSIFSFGSNKFTEYVSERQKRELQQEQKVDENQEQPKVEEQKQEQPAQTQEQQEQKATENNQEQKENNN